jgi:hypothetical protein
MRAAAATFFAFSLFAALSPPAAADTHGTRWLKERVSLEWMVGAGAWRTAFSIDSRVPGFDTVMGGGELTLGLEFYGGLGVVLSGRFLGGQRSHASDSGRYLEGMGSIGLQLRISETVRLRAGAAAGQALTPDENATLVGGWIGASFDLFALGGGRLSMALSVRLDADALLDTKKILPDQTMGLALGIGIRY